MDIKVLTIINPTSGKGNLLDKSDEIKQNLEQQKMTVDIKYTRKEHNAKNIIENYEDERDLILVCGGDGTLNEAVTALMNRNEHDVSLSFVPMGTTNDLARTLEMPVKDVSITKRLLESKAKLIDVGRINNEKYFCYVAAFGVMTDVAYKTSPKDKNKYGRWAYYKNAIKELVKIPTYKVKIKYDNKHTEDNFIYGGISNSESIAGFKWFEKGEIQVDDGKFEGIFIRKPQGISGYFKILASFLRKEYSNNPYILFVQASRIEIESDERLEWTIDGEFAGRMNKTVIENCQKAIELAICEKKFNCY